MALNPYELATAGVYDHMNGVYKKSGTLKKAQLSEKFDAQNSTATTKSAVTIVDDFEAGTLDSSYTGDTGDMSVTQNNSPPHGQYRLETIHDAYDQIQSTSGLNAYPQQGDEFWCWVRMGDGTASNTYVAVLFAVQDSSNFYYVRPRAATDEIELVLPSGTTSTAVTLATSTWYDVKVQWDDGSTFGGNAGDITAEIFDTSGTSLATVSGNDTSYTTGGIGFGIPDTAGGADYYRITNR